MVIEINLIVISKRSGQSSPSQRGATTHYISINNSKTLLYCLSFKIAFLQDRISWQSYLHLFR